MHHRRPHLASTRTIRRILLALLWTLLATGTTAYPEGVPLAERPPGSKGASAECAWASGFWASGFDRRVWALAVFDDGTGEALYAGGNFTTVDDQIVNYIAKWDGSVWTPLGSGMDFVVYALSVYDDGTGPALYAGGTFTRAGGVTANYVAKWDGSVWTPLGSGMNSEIRALSVYDDGTGPALYAGGYFTRAGGVTADHMAKWDGSSWTPLGSGTSDVVFALSVYDDGTGPALYAGGYFTTGGGTANNIAKWDGSSWTPLGSGVNSFVYALSVYDDGTEPALYAGGSFTTADGVTANSIAKWDGSGWTPLGSGVSLSVEVLSVYDDGTGSALYAGGVLTTAGGVAVDHIAKWDGSAWTPLGSGVNSYVHALSVYDDGTGPALYAGGEFTTAGGVTANRIAKWNGFDWTVPYTPASANGMNYGVWALSVHDDGTGPALYAGGDFTTAGGVTANNIAKWDGSGWTPLGSGMNDWIMTLSVYNDGTGPALYAGGWFITAGGDMVNYIAKWDGSIWVPLGSGMNELVHAVSVYDDGTGPALYAGGYFTTAGGVPANYIAKWDGSGWTPLGSGMNNSVYGLSVYDDGTGPALYAGGYFTTAGGVTANYIAKWDGSTWTPLGSGMNDRVDVLSVYDDGTGPALYAGGFFSTAGGVTANHIAKWDGSNWTPLGSGMNDWVYALSVYDDGTGPALFAGGRLTTAGGLVSSHIAKWSCAAAPSAELSITQFTDTTEIIPGEVVTWNIEVTNHGPADAPTATLSDNFPPDLTCAWTSSSTGGATGSTSDSGPVLDDTLQLPAGSTVTYTVTCNVDPAASGTVSNTATIASPADSTPGNNSDTVTWTVGPPLAPGDCNGDRLVDANDVTACNQEIFDGDGAFWYDVPAGTYHGRRTGCDANADTFVDAGDVSCKHLLISAASCSTAPPPAVSDVELSLPYEIPITPDGKLIVEVTLEPGDDVNSVAFALDFDSEDLGLDPTDADGDGIPDAVRFPDTSTFTRFFRFDAGDSDGELDFLVTDPTQALTAGVLVEIEFEYLGSGTTVESGVVFSRNPLASFGDLDGRSRPGRTILKNQPLETLILTHTSRMQSLLGMTPAETLTLFQQLQRLADHPRVRGRVVDLGSEPGLTVLYQAWDDAGNDPDGANNVLFGNQGIHDVLLRELAVYPGVEYLILVGDDRILPMARLRDFTFLQRESAYTDGPDPGLTPDGTSVGQALHANRFLSDDPLAARFAIHPQDLDYGELILPDLAVGRLVETPEEILTAIDTYLAQDGFLNVSPPFGPDHRALVTGYDFLIDSGKRICRRWKSNFPDPPSVNCDLLSRTWGLPTVPERRTALRDHLAGGYNVMSLNGHATHYEEGVPGQGYHDIEGLNAVDFYGPDACSTPSLGALDFFGSLVYSPGCHGGLPVPGSCAGDADHSLDLAQTFLSRGVQAYVANTGYGWGLVHGIGYSEEMVNLLTQELTAGGNVVIGDAVLRTKERYYMESPRYDLYDTKTSLQWTLYGFPTYEIRTGIASKAADRELAASETPSRPAVERFGALSVERRLSKGGDPFDLPDYLTRLELRFDLQAAGIYTKYDTTGEIVETAGCPDPEGCYYTLNGLVERSTGETDLPIQPYLVYDSRLSGTSQHGILWKGGTYEEETGWVPIFGRLITNGSPPPDLGSTPRTIRIRPRNPRLRKSLGEDPLDCRPADVELNSVVLTTGEAVWDDNLEYSIEHLFRKVHLEIFYYNNTLTGEGNCDRTGPEFGDGPHHEFLGTAVRWSVDLSNQNNDVWRVVVVYDDGTLDEQGRHLWIPVELQDDGTGVWQGSVPVSSFEQFTYFLQAVDRHGNVSWLLYLPADEPSSGVSLDLPLPVVVEDNGLIFADDLETGDLSRWSGWLQ